MVCCVTLLNLYFCFVFLICSAALANLEKAWFGLDRIELAQCRLIGFTQIVTVVTSVVPTFFSCIALFGFVSFAFRFLVLLALLDCAGGFRSCGSDHGLCPLDSHKPLKRLDRNFYMDALLLLFGSSGFVLCCDCGGLLSSDLRQT